MFIVRRIPLSNSKPLAELKKFNSGDLLPSVTRQPEYIMLNKGSNKKVTLICYRVGVMTFSLGAFYPTGQISSPWGASQAGGGLESQN